MFRVRDIRHGGPCRRRFETIVTQSYLSTPGLALSGTFYAFDERVIASPGSPPSFVVPSLEMVLTTQSNETPRCFLDLQGLGHHQCHRLLHRWRPCPSPKACACPKHTEGCAFKDIRRDIVSSNSENKVVAQTRTLVKAWAPVGTKFVATPKVFQSQGRPSLKIATARLAPYWRRLFHILSPRLLPLSGQKNSAIWHSCRSSKQRLDLSQSVVSSRHRDLED